MRRAIVLAVLAVVLATSLTLVSAASAADRKVRLTVKEKSIVVLVNRERGKRGLKPLRIHVSLTRAARAHSRDMAARQYFSHVSRSGRTPAQRMKACGYSPTRCRRWSVGENIAWATAGYAGAQATVRAWMKSPAHRRIILTRSFRDIGVGMARGALERNGITLEEVTYYTLDVGRRVRL